MKDAWHDPAFAQEWDETTDIGNPTRSEQLDIILSLMERLHRPGGVVLDLGVGSGQLEERLLRRVPDIRMVGVDSSAAMLQIARRRLASAGDRVHFVEGDFTEIEGLTLPYGPYQMAVSVQALHHVPRGGKQDLFRQLFRLLEPKAVLILMDRVAIRMDGMRDVYKALWERLEQRTEAKSGWSGDYFLDRLRTKDDFPDSVETHLALLEQAGFVAACVHLHLDRAVLVGVRSGPLETGA